MVAMARRAVLARVLARYSRGAIPFRLANGTKHLSWGARSSRPLPSASRRRAGHNHLVTPFSEWILPPRLFGETPNRATETVALPFSDCMVPAKVRRRLWLFSQANYEAAAPI